MAALQLDFFAEPPPPNLGPVPHVPDPLVDSLVTSGIAPNEYLLTINRSIFFPAVMGLPSRLFRFPIEFVDRARREDGKSALLLNHPDLARMPFVGEIEERTGVRPVWEATDEFGRERDRYSWCHALDLLTDEHWKDLLATRNFTTRNGIVSGLKYHADYGGLSTVNMRSVLAEIEEPEPDDMSAAYLASDQVKITNAAQGQFVGFARDTENAVSIWAAIHGLEAKKFKRDKSGFLRFSPAFLAEKLEAAA